MTAQVLTHTPARPRETVPPRRPRTVQVLTDRNVAQLKRRVRPFAVRDKLTGLELRVRPDGKNTWSLRYRVHGVQRRWKVGPYPTVSLAKARKVARNLLLKMSTGIDPRIEERAARLMAQEARAQAERDANRLTFGRLAEHYIEEHARPHKRTWKVDQRYLMSDCVAWATRPVDEYRASGRARADGRFAQAWDGPARPRARSHPEGVQLRARPRPGAVEPRRAAGQGHAQGKAQAHAAAHRRGAAQRLDRDGEATGTDARLLAAAAADGATEDRGRRHALARG